jgi:hypothetical protein
MRHEEDFSVGAAIGKRFPLFCLVITASAFYSYVAGSKVIATCASPGVDRPKKNAAQSHYKEYHIYA